MYKLIVFDLDGTLTQHRSKLGEQNRAILEKLSKKYKLLMLGAGGCERIYNQMDQFPIDILGNYGLQESVIEDGSFRLIRNDSYTVDKDYFSRTCATLREKYGYTEFVGEHMDFHASGMVTFPLLGTKADIADKVAFDPDRKKRAVMYSEVCALFPDFSVFIGGSSSFDFVKTEYNKYNALMRYAHENGYDKSEILFVGDDFGDGGGDSHIRLGGLDYVFIDDYTRTPEKLEFLLK
ncbi:MAG: HAD family phosphatase [Clostridia bacterium]|nr:HAD family phosphatase [Clostridia bacterium]